MASGAVHVVVASSSSSSSSSGKESIGHASIARRQAPPLMGIHTRGNGLPASDKSLAINPATGCIFDGRRVIGRVRCPFDRA